MQTAINSVKKEADFFQPAELIKAQDFVDFLQTESFLKLDQKRRSEDLKQMQDVTQRIRQQVRYIVKSVRCWRERHADLEGDLHQRYSTYEGALCYADLRRHWAYYRHAMKEYSDM